MHVQCSFLFRELMPEGTISSLTSIPSCKTPRPSRLHRTRAAPVLIHGHHAPCEGGSWGSIQGSSKVGLHGHWGSMEEQSWVSSHPLHDSVRSWGHGVQPP